MENSSKEPPEKVVSHSQEKWPVIISSSLQNSDVFTLLNELHKVRVSASIIENSVIFPKSAVAFLILPIRELIADVDHPVLDKKVVERVTEFAQLHRNCFILTTSALMEDNDLAILSTLQERFFTFSLTYYPAHNLKECVTFMLHIAKVTSKPTCTLLKTRLENLATSSVSEEVVLNILSTIGLSCHDTLDVQISVREKENNVLLLTHRNRYIQGCRTLSNIARATLQELMDCSVDQETAKKVNNFFKSNPI